MKQNAPHTSFLSRLFALLVVGQLSANAEDITLTADAWNQWRGSDRDSSITAPAWPDQLGDPWLTKQWQVELNEGYSSPILTADHVFSLETHDKKEEIFRAFDRFSGKELWSYTVPGAMKVPFFAARNGSWARSTPVTDGTRVYFLTMLDVMTCLDVNTGALIWQVDLKEREGTEVPTFGGVSSPLIEGDYLYLQGGHAAAKLDKTSAENNWRVLEDRRGMFGGSFSSPIIAELHGLRQFIVQTRSTLAGVDLESGEILWATPVEASRGMNILTPLVHNNHIFTATYGGGSFCYKLGYQNGEFDVSMVWENRKLEGYMTTPVTVDGYIYHQGRDKKLYCLDFKTGKIQWSSDEEFGQYWSMVVNDDRILALDQRGSLILFQASKDRFTILDQRKVSDEPTWAHLAVSGDQLFVRGLKHMTAFSWKGQ